MKGFRRHCLIFTAALALLGAPDPAWADCTNPAAPESWTRYDFTAHTLYLCDGTNWLAMAGGSSSGSAGYIQFSNGSGGFSNSGTTAGQQLFWDDTNKRLGIGTTTPSQTLHLVGTVRVERSGTPNQFLDIASGGSSQNALSFNSVESNKKLFLIESLHGGTGSASGALDFVFRTGSSSSPSEIMRIRDNGNVGIGTQTPRAKFDVQGDGGAYGPIHKPGGGATLGEYGAAITDVSVGSVARDAVGLQIDSVSAQGDGYSAIGQIISRVTATHATGSGIAQGLVVSDISNVAGNQPLANATGLYVSNITGNAYGKAFGLRIGAVTYAGANVPSYSAGLQIDDAITNTTTAANAYAINILSTAKSYFAGNVGIGTATPSTKLDVNGDVKAVSYLYSSDRRLKTDIAPLSAQLERIAALEPVSYVLKSDPERRARLGLIAQDVEAVYPEIVQGQGEAMKAVDYAALVSPLIAAVKELKAANDNLAARIEILEGQRSVAASPVAQQNAPQTGTRQPTTRRTLNQ